MRHLAVSSAEMPGQHSPGRPVQSWKLIRLRYYLTLDKMGDDVTAASFLCTGPDRHWLAPPATSASAGLSVTFHVPPSVGVH